MRKLGVNEIQNIATGAALLGAGGGGNPFIGKMMAITAVKKLGPVTLLDPQEVPDEAVCVSSSQIGAPAVSMEKFPNGNELQGAFMTMEQNIGKKIFATFPIEAGGINSMIPIVVAAQNNLPLVDVDGMGRAFPELQMSTFVLAGHSVTPIVMGDERGNTALINTVDARWAEKIARAITVEMGATAMMTSDTLTGIELRRDGVINIMTLCEKIGQLINRANEFSSLEEALGKLLKLTHGFRMLTAKIIDIRHTTKGGFNFGTVTLSGLDDDQGKNGTVEFQNENIILKVDGAVLATAPDLITLVDTDTLTPITNEDLHYGKRVHVLGLPCNAKWRTPAGIASVGPRYFKYDVDYVPLEERIQQAKEPLTGGNANV